MLLRNLSQSTGLCNGTRLVVFNLGEKVIEATVMTGSKIGDVQSKDLPDYQRF